MNMTVIWAVAAGVLLLIEGMTAAMCSIWFAAGAVVALVAAALGAPIWLQITLFVAVSAVCFWLLFPRLKNSVKKGSQATNADMVIGQSCRVTEPIDNLAGTGAVQIGGKTWTARTADGNTIENGALVQVEKIQGVKLIVKPLRAEIKL